MEEDGVGGGRRWRIFRPDLYWLLFLVVLNYMPVLWICEELERLRGLIANLQMDMMTCCLLFAGFVMIGSLSSFFLRIRPFFPRLEAGAKIIIGVLSTVSLFCVWIVALNMWFWIRKQTTSCRTSEGESTCYRAVFKLVKLISKDPSLEWVTNAPNWILTVIAGIYTSFAVRECYQLSKTEKRPAVHMSNGIRSNSQRKSYSLTFQNVHIDETQVHQIMQESVDANADNASQTSSQTSTRSFATPAASAQNNNGSGSTVDTVDVDVQIEDADNAGEAFQPFTQTRRRGEKKAKRVVTPGVYDDLFTPASQARSRPVGGGPGSTTGSLTSSIGSPRRRSERLSLSGQMVKTTRNKTYLVY